VREAAAAVPAVVCCLLLSRRQATALHVATIKNNVEMARLLLQRGANVSATTEFVLLFCSYGVYFLVSKPFFKTNAHVPFTRN
jgi:hypothetical protein